ncbi:MAG: hypothetical protein M1839_008388 [Geoglossum umbratile]|nr:MAG: hypothetical protein M1839_008388 [Geoglossum umbratile]
MGDLSAVITLASRAWQTYEKICRAGQSFQDVKDDSQMLHQHLQSIVILCQNYDALLLDADRLDSIIEKCNRNFQVLEDLVGRYPNRSRGVLGAFKKATFPEREVADVRANLSQLRLDLQIFLELSRVAASVTGRASVASSGGPPAVETKEAIALANEADIAFQRQTPPGTPGRNPSAIGKVPLEAEHKVIDWASVIELSRNPRDLTEEGPLEENICDSSLVETANMRDPHLIVFRKRDGKFRIVHEYGVPSIEGKSGQRIESKIFDFAYMGLIPVYTTPATSAPLILLLYDKHNKEETWYHFKSPEDVWRFQQALTGAMVKFDQRGVSCQLGGRSTKTDARVQIWYPKPLYDKPLDPMSLSPKSSMSGISRTSTIQSMQPNISRSSIYLSPTTPQPVKSRLTAKPDAEWHELPRSPAVLVCTVRNGKYAYIYLQFRYLKLGGGLTCCASHLTCRHVLLRRKGAKARVFYADSDDFEGLTSWDLGRVLSQSGPPAQGSEELDAEFVILEMPSDERKREFMEDYENCIIFWNKSMGVHKDNVRTVAR